MPPKNVSLPCARGGGSPKARRRDCLYHCSIYSFCKMTALQSPTRLRGSPLYTRGPFSFMLRDSSLGWKGAFSFMLRDSSLGWKGAFLFVLRATSLCWGESFYLPLSFRYNVQCQIPCGDARRAAQIKSCIRI